MTYSAGFVMKEQGFSLQEIRSMENMHHEILLFYRGVLPKVELLRKMDGYKSQPWFPFSYMDDYLPDNPKETKWYREMDYNPIPAMEKLNIPVLLIFPESDPWVDIQKSIDSWREHGPNDLSIHKIHKANHFLKSISHSGLEGIEGPCSEEYINILKKWTRDRLGNRHIRFRQTHWKSDIKQIF